MAVLPQYRPHYQNSWALVIGINAYQFCSPLGYARNDAEAVADALGQDCGFETNRIEVLCDADATGEAIRNAYLKFTSREIGEDDRIVVFFAGHGYTRTAGRREVGFLVPVDGDPERVASLIRWDDLTRNAELIPAKHVLFIMDACYGGLAVTRSLASGNARFLKDMLTRYSRQVLTAGKADEVVADSGGPRQGHSVFTGHLLDAIAGGAATPTGVMSTNAVIAYVHDRVANDPHSRQTPHFGYIDGDGDLILSGVPVDAKDLDPRLDSDTLVQTPALAQNIEGSSNPNDLPDQVKKLLSDSSGRIQLHDLFVLELRRAMALSAGDSFSLNAALSSESARGRLSEYESATKRVATLLMLTASWGAEQHYGLLQKAIARLSDGLGEGSGQSTWVEFRWYPVEYSIYAAGIAAVACENFVALKALFFTRIPNKFVDSGSSIAATAVAGHMGQANEVFKLLPDYERRFTPKSDYLHKQLQPSLEDLLFLGSDYERHFDRFELLYALTYAHAEVEGGRSCWGPPGRFGWKSRRDPSQGPFRVLVREAESLGEHWPPLKAGLFGGSLEQFKTVAEQYSAYLARLPWF